MIIVRSLTHGVPAGRSAAQFYGALFITAYTVLLLGFTLVMTQLKIGVFNVGSRYRRKLVYGELLAVVSLGVIMGIKFLKLSQ